VAALSFSELLVEPPLPPTCPRRYLQPVMTGELMQRCAHRLRHKHPSMCLHNAT